MTQVLYSISFCYQSSDDSRLIKCPGSELLANGRLCPACRRAHKESSLWESIQCKLQPWVMQTNHQYETISPKCCVKTRCDICRHLIRFPLNAKNCFAVHAYARKHKCLWKIINNSACVLHMCYQWPMFSHLLTAFLARKGCLVHPALYGGATQPWWYKAWLILLSKPLERPNSANACIASSLLALTHQLQSLPLGKLGL